MVFTHQLNSYLTEKKFYKEIEELYKIDNLQRLAINDIVSILETTEPENIAYAYFYYPNGTVKYSTQVLSEQSVLITLNCETLNGRKSNVRVMYDVNDKVLKDWTKY
ncbi:competence type IV pilus minor pilin ComGG [Cytobacillus sp. S13-E01]|nr:competence type IV pilus minor pilin ComGG [Cytobacillus sp. S13-E01]MDF0727786.1 competence type IV pilus minor pilin ComGG [Cytobacillus sp. S13-E01]